MTTILDQIIATKVEELATRKAVQTTTELERLVASSELTTPLGFVDALMTRAAARTPGSPKSKKHRPARASSEKTSTRWPSPKTMPPMAQPAYRFLLTNNIFRGQTPICDPLGNL